MANIFVVEDETNLQKILKYDLTHEGYNVTLSGDGLDAAVILKHQSFDIYLLDWMLPELSGLELCKIIRQHDQTGHIIMLTARSDEFDKVEALNAGADDYITKPFSNRELIARIQARLRKQHNLSESKQLDKIVLNDITIIPEKYETYLGDEKIELTLREYELLLYLVKHANKVVSRDQLLESLWGYSYDGDTRTIDVHMFKIRSKFENETIKFKTIRGIGYMLETK
ncbi:response regulator transcription factor [Culicoidibacter larvae]|uniref:Response regulator transcription factor n=1 Tax=Culicoidibacter larvae TaxID=2579976 RepID=A0A5R8QGN0_9FIRM|nr:response regulator transcription factor [Culicoidibacter larvae]